MDILPIQGLHVLSIGSKNKGIQMLWGKDKGNGSYIEYYTIYGTILHTLIIVWFYPCTEDR